MNKNMFIVILNYLKPLGEVNEKREEHLRFISNHIVAGKFLTAGRQNPALGGVIIAHNITREELKDILVTDPYYINKLAEHTIIEFIPGMYAEGIEEILKKLI